MANNNAFTVEIGPKGIDPKKQDSDTNPENGYVHQSSPTWVLTFINWQVRDTLRTKSSQGDALTTRNPLIVESDCISLTVTTGKGTLTPSMEAILLSTDINYETAISPGDFVFVNMLNWPKDAEDVVGRAGTLDQINGINDGFKGFFKVQGVRRVLQSDPSTGLKRVVYRINGFAFTEFNNSIYLNPFLLNSSSPQTDNIKLFTGLIFNYWSDFVNKGGKGDVQNILALLIRSFIGEGLSSKARNPSGSLLGSPNVHYLMPSAVGKLLGFKEQGTVSTAGGTFYAAKDIYTYLFGIQEYASGSSQQLSDALNPIGLTQAYNRFFFTTKPCNGISLLKPEWWNQVKVWDILNQYVNSPLNELYTCFKVSMEGKVMPTLTFRQIPFTSEDFANQNFGVLDQQALSIPVTKFMSLPRWKINPSMVFSQDIGRDEAARINYVQYYSKSLIDVNGTDLSLETAKHNYVFDIKDVERSGLRPYVAMTQFGDLDTSVNKSPIWARIVGDALIGGHLKFNGSITCIGIVDPITVGDNLELDGIVYHIEQVTHSCQNDLGSGVKSFRTTMALSMGVSTDSNSSGTAYAEMTYTNAYDQRKVDGNNNQILPGVSESQDTIQRSISVDSVPDKTESSPFPQPSTSIQSSLPLKEKDKK